MRVRYRSRALADLEEIHRFLAQRSSTGARHVLVAIRAAIDAIAAHPESSPRTSDQTIRVKVVGRYSYKIFYSFTEDAIEIVHIRHAARRPWLDDG